MSNSTGHNNTNDELLAKYLAGEANPQEAMEVDDWVAAGEENKQIFHNLFYKLQAIARRQYYKPDTNVTWQQVKALLNNSTSHKIRPLRWWMTAAAAVLLFATGWLYLQNQSRSETMQTAIAAAGSVKTITLADNSKVTLNAGGQLIYPASFNNHSRKVSLTGGGYFEIAASAKAPFIVAGNEVMIEVLGTTFNTAASDTTVLAEVYQGKVRLYNNYGNVIVEAGQTGIYNKPTRTFRLLQQVNKNSNAWATMRFYFENDSLPTICASLSEAYHKKIIFRDATMAGLKMSSVFENQSLDYILEVIAATLNIEYTYEGNNEIVLIQK